LYPTLYPWGAILVIGTRWSYNDLYAMLLEKWQYRVHQAILNEQEQQVLWSRYWSYEKLVERRNEIGTLHFNCQYQNDPTGMEGDLLKREWLQYWDKPPPNRLMRFAGIDPALGEGDLAAIATLGYNRNSKQGYLLNVWAEKVPFPTLLQTINHYYKKYRYSRIYVETNAFQKSLMYQQELRGLPLVGTQTDKNKERRFISMSSHFESQRILVNPLLEHSEFYTEWIQFPRSQYDDALDAVEIVTRRLFGKRQRQPYRSRLR
jgi:predicted phage terminase large subunit-like protein